MAFFNMDPQRAFIHEPPKYCRCVARQAYRDSQPAAIVYVWEASALGVSECPLRVGCVSSLMQEAAVRLLDAATVSNPPHC
jgi:hypothetical protein